MQNLFLAPARQENLDRSIEKGVPMRKAEEILPSTTMDQLREAHPGKYAFRCWAMTEPSRHFFDLIRVGDAVLFKATGTGRFTHRANVAFKFESPNFGFHVWPITPGEPWTLVYTLDNHVYCNTPLRKVQDILGYDPNFTVPGVIRVDPERLRKALRRFDSMDAMLESLCR